MLLTLATYTYFRLQAFERMLSFSSKLLVTNIFNHINNNIFTVILGKFYSGQEVGYFTQANKWNYMGHSLISGTVNSVAQPVLSSLSDERNANNALSGRCSASLPLFLFRLC